MREYRGLTPRDIDELEFERFIMFLPDPKDWGKAGQSVDSIEDVFRLAGMA